MKLVYIAGPYRAKNAWEIEQNIRRAEALSLAVWKSRANIIGICQHCNARFFHGAIDERIRLEASVALIKRCDAILLVSHWQSSEGTNEEIDCAGWFGIPVFDNLTTLIAWSNGAQCTKVGRISQIIAE